MLATLRNPNRPRPPTTGAPKPPAPDTAGDARTDAADEPVETPDRWWRESSFDLRHGLEVREEDTIPGQLLDELFTPKPKPKA